MVAGSKLNDIVISSWDSIKNRKFRFALNLIGILIGCAAVTGLVSITQGLSNNVSTSLQIFGPQNILVMAGTIEMEKGFIAGEMGYQDFQMILKAPYIETATPIIANKYVTYDVKGTTYRAQIYGVEEKFVEINTQVEIVAGRKLIKGDTGIAIIGSNIAKPKNQEEPILNVGDRITITSKVNENIKSMTLRVIGVLKETGASFGVDLDNSIAIALRDAQQFFETGNQYSYVMAKATSIQLVNDAARSLKTLMGREFEVFTYESAKRSFDRITGTVQSVLGGIAAISLIVAGVGIINTMMISVVERTKEIGVLKAVGAKSSHIMLIFLSESTLTGLTGGVIGSVLGFVLAELIGSSIGVVGQPSAVVGIEVIGFAILTSMISGVYPSLRAARLNPAEALRHE